MAKSMISIRGGEEREHQTAVELARIHADPDGSKGRRRRVVGPPAAQPCKLLVTPKEAAEILSVGRTTIFELIASGQLPSVRIRSSRRIPTVALQQLVHQLLDETRGEQL
jgi:excisionase family DNA binding protein